MATSTLKTRIKHKIDTASNWASSNLVPLEGELIIYKGDKPQIKVGDGSTAVGSLPFIKAGSDTTITQALTSGTEIGSISIDGVATKLYAPSTIAWENITGKPSSYTPSSHSHDYIQGNYTREGGQQPPSYIGTHALKCNMMNGFVGSGVSVAGYMDTLLMNAYSWSDVPYATALGILKTNSTTPRAWIACGPNGDKWTGVAELLTDKNYTSYAPTKTGAGASGTWDISISGNAATASAWTSAQTLTLAGDLSGSVSIKGNAAMTLTATVKDDSHNHSNYAAKDCNIKEYTFDLSSYSTNNYYLFYFASDDWDLNCEIKSPNVGGDNAYNQNHMHFILLAQGWSDTPRILNILYSGCYSANEITIMGIVVGAKNGGNAIAVRGGMKYYLRCNKIPILKTSTFTDSGETFICGSTSWSGGDATSVMWTNDGANKAYTNVGFYGAVWN